MNKKGFTLTELLIVIAIIGILASIILVATLSTKSNARNTRRKADLTAIKSALEMYYQVHGVYPSTCADSSKTCATGAWCGEPGSNYQSCITSGANAGTRNYSGPTGYVPNIAPQSMVQLPVDPNRSAANNNPGTCTAVQRAYLYKSNGQNYKLLAHCTPEKTLDTTDPFYDPTRPIYAWQVSSDSTSLAW